MKYLLYILTIAVFTSIILGFVLDVTYSEKLVGFGVAGLFLVVFPLFSYYRWKDKDIKDYMINKENLDKMRESQRKNKH
ncbi:signal peptidase complex subunit 1 family protein [Flavobacteriaceae bacterium GSB9]|nr:signal peptidase complex subunit 1 family protein [Flavobacteriaceae bacterium GSB9]